MPSKLASWPDPRQQEKLRRPQRTCGQYDLARGHAVHQPPGPQVLDRGGAAAVEEQSRRVRVRLDVEDARAGAIEIHARRAGPDAVIDVGVPAREPFLLIAVDIVRRGVASFHARLEEGSLQR